jgi:hypothetical protein
MRGTYVDLARLEIDGPGDLVPFGVDATGETIFAWDRAAERADGELEVVLWINEIGERVESFPAFLDLVCAMLTAEIDDRRRLAPPAGRRRERTLRGGVRAVMGRISGHVGDVFLLNGTPETHPRIRPTRLRIMRRRSAAKPCRRTCSRRRLRCRGTRARSRRRRRIHPPSPARPRRVNRIPRDTPSSTRGGGFVSTARAEGAFFPPRCGELR